MLLGGTSALKWLKGVGIGKTDDFSGPEIRIWSLDPSGKMKSGVSLVAGVSVVRNHLHECLWLAVAARGCKNGGIPSHGFGESPFWGDLRWTGIDNWFKMYANGCYWEASGWVDQSISLIRRKNMGLTRSGIRILSGKIPETYLINKRYPPAKNVLSY